MRLDRDGARFTPRGTRNYSTFTLGGTTRNDDRCRSQQPAVELVARPDDAQDMFFVHVVARLVRDGFVLVGVKGLANRADFLESMIRQGGFELGKHHIDTSGQ